MADSTPASGDRDPRDVFADMPLFREIQRVLMASPGPVNWELARQVAVATASLEGATETDPGPGDLEGFREAVRGAELQVSGLTGMAVPSELPDIKLIRRADWVNSGIECLEGLVEPAAKKMRAALDTLQPTPEQTFDETADSSGTENVL